MGALNLKYRYSYWRVISKFFVEILFVVSVKSCQHYFPHAAKYRNSFMEIKCWRICLPILPFWVHMLPNHLTPISLPTLLTSGGHRGKMLVSTAAHSLLCFLWNLWVSPTKLSFYGKNFLVLPSVSSSHLFSPSPAFPFIVRKLLGVFLGTGFPASLSFGFWIPTLPNGTCLWNI